MDFCVGISTGEPIERIIDRAKNGHFDFMSVESRYGDSEWWIRRSGGWKSTKPLPREFKLIIALDTYLYQHYYCVIEFEESRTLKVYGNMKYPGGFKGP
jgi:hypothetical protein